jgi:multidrug efflux pump subunit AcrA (membrane-fusion protein)
LPRFLQTVGFPSAIASPLPRFNLMSTLPNASTFHGRRWLLFGVVAIGLIAAAAWAASGRWLSLNAPSVPTGESPDGHADHDHEESHAGHDHDHAGHSEETSIELSQNALKNIGFIPVTVNLGNFEKTTTIPAIVVEQPGRTQVHVTSPLTGIVTEINVVAGEAVEPNSPMFQIRLTHEEVVTAQRDYLLTSESLDVVNREIERLKTIGEGVIAGKRVLEQQYERQKLEASLLASEQALLLHGLTEEQVAEIRRSKKLLRTLTIRAPNHSHTGNECGKDHLFHVQRLSVSQGQQVEAGQELCVLADHCELFIEGRAFEDDANRLREAAQKGWSISATHLTGEQDSDKTEGLKVLYLADKIDPESRAFHFYLNLPNKVVLDQKSPEGRRFIQWHFKPGQRMELDVPVEQWTNRIVLPVDAVVEEGAEMYVYRQNGDHFDRVPVHVEYRDRDSVVIANNGALFPGDVVAGEGAYQMHLALKNKAGGGIDPHAGHNH